VQGAVSSSFPLLPIRARVHPVRSLVQESHAVASSIAGGHRSKIALQA
jgi:hypothetical protein